MFMIPSPLQAQFETTLRLKAVPQNALSFYLARRPRKPCQHCSRVPPETAFCGSGILPRPPLGPNLHSGRHLATTPATASAGT